MGNGEWVIGNGELISQLKISLFLLSFPSSLNIPPLNPLYNPLPDFPLQEASLALKAKELTVKSPKTSSKLGEVKLQGRGFPK